MNMNYIPQSRRQSLPISVKTFKVAILSSIIVLAAIILYYFNPAGSQLYPSSPFRALTGLYCPGCGSLRAIHQLLHGHFLAALDLNPLMVLATPYLIYSFISYTSPVILGQKIPQVYVKPALIWLFLKVVFAYWVLRNIPLPPFNWLAP
ncbi:DUF2752 domain-containing protein [Rivularia sp. UHCC 0363]|uniref:DUF2752 domain-containing protein n=1 Tax=Rivularia sp. UHCC 0363 TaxID=3110244 RepID=UPI002B1F0A73|nr:DUF2752 domain-containing protein [Rivularia sp. UHCC 0363]MEA5596169.1 DUF2752 domain-containing protein [Rivularia sp. UHCC 0363]